MLSWRFSTQEILRNSDVLVIDLSDLHNGFYQPRLLLTCNEILLSHPNNNALTADFVLSIIYAVSLIVEESRRISGSHKFGKGFDDGDINSCRNRNKY